jgi:hypothetical protein
LSSRGLDFDLVDAFVDGTLAPSGQGVLADQVAQVIACHWAAPNPVVYALNRLRRHLGGESQLFTWLEQHPGRPRMVAHIFTVITLLDRYGSYPAMVTALRELRQREDDPRDLKGLMVPVTDEATLVSLSGTIELLLCEGDFRQAADASRAAVGILRTIAPRAAGLDADLRDLARQADKVDLSA